MKKIIILLLSISAGIACAMETPVVKDIVDDITHQQYNSASKKVSQLTDVQKQTIALPLFLKAYETYLSDDFYSSRRPLFERLAFNLLNYIDPKTKVTDNQVPLLFLALKIASEPLTRKLLERGADANEKGINNLYPVNYLLALRARIRGDWIHPVFLLLEEYGAYGVPQEEVPDIES